MKIKETAERDCCSSKDLKPIEGAPKVGHVSQYVFCIYCGKHKVIYSYIDAAGGYDWEYKNMDLPWVKK